MANSAMASMPLVRVISMLRARMSSASTGNGRPAADEELVTISERTRPGKRRAKRVAMPPPRERPPMCARRSPR